MLHYKKNFFIPEIVTLHNWSLFNSLEMIVSIPAECLQEIFEHLQDDEFSLHSILLVNRFWCKNVLPILWRQPFYLCAKKGASPKLVETYIQCMDNESKCRLKRE